MSVGRRQVELCFRWSKRNLKLRNLPGAFENAAKIWVITWLCPASSERVDERSHPRYQGRLIGGALMHPTNMPEVLAPARAKPRPGL